MTRNLLAATVLGLACGTAAVAEDAKKLEPAADKPAGKGGFDRGKAFDKADADGNGKLTKEEFVKFAEDMAEKIADKTGKTLPAGFAGKRFDKMDADADGVVTKAEYEKATPAFGGKRGPDSPGKSKGDADKKPDAPAAK